MIWGHLCPCRCFFFLLIYGWYMQFLKQSCLNPWNATQDRKESAITLLLLLLYNYSLHVLVFGSTLNLARLLFSSKTCFWKSRFPSLNTKKCFQSVSYCKKRTHIVRKVKKWALMGFFFSFIVSVKWHQLDFYFSIHWGEMTKNVFFGLSVTLTKITLVGPLYFNSF